MEQGLETRMHFRPWWWEAAPPREPGPALLPRRADVVIIGAGYTGLSAALTAARAGREVLVLEAEAPGFGASTRNGGQVGSGNQKFTIERLRALYGDERARALVNEGTAMLEYITDLIEREGIACEFRRVGRFRGCVQPKHYEAMARDLEDLHKFAGVEFEMVPRAQLSREVDSTFYWGGSVLPHDAALHPGLYHRGLLERAEAAGVSVAAFTPVVAVHREKSCARVGTTRGEVTACEVIVATNGYTDAALAGLRRRIVPIGSAIIATEELPPGLMEQLMPMGRVYGNTARVFHYFRPSPDGRRLLWGGRVGRLAPQDSRRAFTHLQRDMLKVFPQLEGVRITHAWSGTIGYTFDTMPHLGCRDGIWYAMGYCGTGVSRSTWFGNKVALKLLGDPQGQSAFDDLEFPGHLLHRAARYAVPFVETWYRFKDALAL